MRMADTFCMFRHAKSIEYCHAQLDKKIKGHEQLATTCCLALLLILFMFVFGNTLIRGSAMKYHSAWPDQILTAVPNATRAQRRTLRRVISFMSGHCTHNDIVFGPQITLNSKPYSHRVALFCKKKQTLCDPKIVHHGEREIQCMDEHNAKTKLKRRKTPLSLSSACGTEANFSDHKDVCVAGFALEELNSSW